MSGDRRLIHGPTLQPGDEVLTPSGRHAFVEKVDRDRGEVVVRWPSEIAAFRPAHLRRVDTGTGAVVFLGNLDAEPATPAETPAEATQEGER